MLRPLIPPDKFSPTDQLAITCSVQSYDRLSYNTRHSPKRIEGDPVCLAVNSASAALLKSSIPFNGPAAAVKVMLDWNDNVIIDPSYEDLKSAKLEMLYAGNYTSCLMLEFGAKGNGNAGVPEAHVAKLIKYAHKALKPLLDVQKDFASGGGGGGDSGSGSGSGSADSIRSHSDLGLLFEKFINTVGQGSIVGSAIPYFYETLTTAEQTMLKKWGMRKFVETRVPQLGILYTKANTFITSEDSLGEVVIGDEDEDVIVDGAISDIESDSSSDSDSDSSSDEEDEKAPSSHFNDAFSEVISKFSHLSLDLFNPTYDSPLDLLNLRMKSTRSKKEAQLKSKVMQFLADEHEELEDTNGVYELFVKKAMRGERAKRASLFGRREYEPLQNTNPLTRPR